MVTDFSSAESVPPKISDVAIEPTSFSSGYLFFLKLFHQKSRSAGLEPVIAEFHLCKGVQKAERVVNVFGAFLKDISVVPFLQLLLCLPNGQIVGVCQLLYFFRKGAFQFFLRNAADTLEN